MRYVAPTRGCVEPLVFDRLPLAAWHDCAALLRGEVWPSIAALNEHWPEAASQRFVAQDAQLLADGLHYEQRIAERGQIATREANWHDLLNALIWLRYPALKRALNQRQISEIARVGPKQRSREQYALTHFDEGGVIVLLRDPALLKLWDVHDWYDLFWRHRQAWRDGVIQAQLFGHALMEQALSVEQLLVGKALVFQVGVSTSMADVLDRVATLIAAGHLLHDPLELRPLPLAGLPGWNAANEVEAFHRSTVCYQAKRADRTYPGAWVF